MNTQTPMTVDAQAGPHQQGPPPPSFSVCRFFYCSSHLVDVHPCTVPPSFPWASWWSTPIWIFLSDFFQQRLKKTLFLLNTWPLHLNLLLLVCEWLFLHSVFWILHCHLPGQKCFLRTSFCFCFLFIIQVSVPYISTGKIIV